MNFEHITPDFLNQNNINPEGMLFSKNHLPYNPKLKGFSRGMRGYGEKAEAMLWKQLKAKQIGYTFNRQKPILNYIADFYCKELNLVVEIDGASHFSEEAQIKDEERDRQMKVLGLVILRFLDSDVRRDPERIAIYIKEQCELIQEKGGEICFFAERVFKSPLPPLKGGRAKRRGCNALKTWALLRGFYAWERQPPDRDGRVGHGQNAGQRSPKGRLNA